MVGTQMFQHQGVLSSKASAWGPPGPQTTAVPSLGLSSCSAPVSAAVEDGFSILITSLCFFQKLNPSNLSPCLYALQMGSFYLLCLL